MPIKLVVTDIDGTIVLPAKHEVSQRVRNAVIAAENAGVEVVPVTGRPFEMAQPVMNLLGFDDLCVVDNGATIRKVQTGEIVWSQWLEPATIRRIVAATLPFVDRFIDYFPEQREVAPDTVIVSEIDWQAPYVFAPIRNELVPELAREIAKIENISPFYGLGFESSPDLTCLQVTKEGATKFNGVGELLKITGIKKEEVLAIGDGRNDVPLFQNAGLKIAVANAADELKELADYVVASVEDDGFAEAIERFVIN